MSAADVGYLAALCEFICDTVQRRQPLANEVSVVSRPEKAGDSAEQAGRLIAPSYSIGTKKKRLGGRTFRLSKVPVRAGS
jgi:hypothetical protein